MIRDNGRLDLDYSVTDATSEFLSFEGISKLISALSKILRPRSSGNI